MPQLLTPAPIVLAITGIMLVLALCTDLSVAVSTLGGVLLWLEVTQRIAERHRQRHSISNKLYNGG